MATKKLVMKASYYEEVLADHRRLVRELDAVLSAPEKPAKQASLCDLIPVARRLNAEAAALRAALEHAMEHVNPDAGCEECKEAAQLLGWEVA